MSCYGVFVAWVWTVRLFACRRGYKDGAAWGRFVGIYGVFLRLLYVFLGSEMVKWSEYVLKWWSNVGLCVACGVVMPGLS